MKIVFASNNKHKLEEIQKSLGDSLTVLSLSEAGIFEEIPETKETIEENAIEKASYIYNKYKLNCFADDTGLEIDHLNGEPGVYSARYAGENCSAQDNVEKVLSKMGDCENRKACFRTIIALIIDGNIRSFEGRVDGSITMQAQGEGGFGYDPIFLPVGADITFAQMSMEEKNAISHRAKAVEKFIKYIRKNLS